MSIGGNNGLIPSPSDEPRSPSAPLASARFRSAPIAVWFAILLIAGLPIGCTKSGTDGEKTGSGQGGRVVVYTSVDEVFSEPICQQFEKETGIQVALVPDTEETKSTGLVNRLIAEKKRPQADLFWSGDPVRAALLKSHGVTAPIASPETSHLPPLYSDPEHHWIAFSARARVLIYHRDRVPKDKRPTSIFDLADPRFRGQACIANPLFGTSSMHAAALFQVLGDERAKAFFQSLVDNDVKILSSNGEVRRRVANGEFQIGLTDTDDVNVAIEEGQPVGFVYPDADGIGTLLIPNAIVLIKGAPHPAEAQKLTDFLLTAKTEAALAASEAAQIPLRDDAVLPVDFPFKRADAIRTMQVDYETLADKLEEISGGFLKSWVDKNQ